MNSITDLFVTQSIGYDTEQVDRYIQVLTQEYNSMSHQLKEMTQKCEEMENAPAANMAAIASVLVNAEIKAKEVIADAEQYKLQVVADADSYKQRLLSSAKEQQAQLVSEAEVQKQQIVAEAEVRAQMTLVNAQNEAARILGGAHLELKAIRDERDRVTAELNSIIERLQTVLQPGLTLNV